ncbi:MAG: hypothetical protein ACRCYZ_05670 [Alphaproteobacteria bacterium]
MKRFSRLFLVRSVCFFSFSSVLSFWIAVLFLNLQPIKAENVAPVVRGNQVYKLLVELQAPQGKWSSDPRHEAILEAHRRALQEAALHYADGSTATLPQLPSDATLLDMVESFSVKKEKVNAAQYRGMFHFTFKPKALEKWLKQPTSETNEAPSKLAEGGAFSTEAVHKIPLLLNVKIASFKDWIQLRKTLDTVGEHLVRQQILSLSQNQGKISLLWKGSADFFAAHLETLGFKVTKLPHQWDIEKSSHQQRGNVFSSKRVVS